MSLYIWSNEAFYGNMSPIENDGSLQYIDDNCNYIWDVSLDRYGTELSNLKVLLYNVNSLGRNPYIIADMSSLVS